MAYNYADTTNYDDQAELIAQTAARIKALRALQAPDLPEQGGGFTSAVTGTKFLGAQPKASILGQLTPLIAQTRAGYDEQQMNEQKKALTQTQIDNMVKWFKATPQGTPGIPAGPDTQEPLGPDDVTGSFVGDPTAAINQMSDPVERQRALLAWENQKKGNMRTVPGTPAVPATGPDPADMMAHAAAGKANPMTRDLAAQYAAYGMIQRPEKLEERGFQSGEKALDRTATLQAAQAKAIADAREHALTRQTTLEAARIRAAGNGNANTGTYVLGPDGVTYVNNKNPADQRPSGMEKPPKPLTEAQIKAQTERQGKAEAVNMILQSYKPEYSGNKEAVAGANETFPVGKYLPYGRDAQKWWSLYRDFRADIKHGRYGASFTGPERKMSNSYDIDVGTDPDVAQKYLQHMTDATNKSVLRAQSLAENPGSRMLPDGSIKLKDGTIVEGTASTVNEDVLKMFAPAAAAEPKERKTRSLPNAVAAAEAAAPAAAAAANVAPTTTPDADVKVNGVSSLDINRQEYNRARNRYNSQPTPANKQARDLAYADLLRAQSEAGSDEGASIPAAIRRANAEMGGSARTQRAAAPKDAPKAKGGWKVERID